MDQEVSSEVETSDVEKLARLLWQVRAESRGDAPEWGLGGYKTAADGIKEEARAILASDWLREREAEAERRGYQRAHEGHRQIVEWLEARHQDDGTGHSHNMGGPHPDCDALTAQVEAIRAHRASLPPEERARIEAEEREAQRESWARQDMD